MVDPKTPDEILSLLDQAQVRLNHREGEYGDFDLRALMWDLINDIRSSIALAANPELIGQANSEEIINTVDDYLVNNYGDD